MYLSGASAFELEIEDELDLASTSSHGHQGKLSAPPTKAPPAKAPPAKAPPAKAPPAKAQPGIATRVGGGGGTTVVKDDQGSKTRMRTASVSAGGGSGKLIATTGRENTEALVKRVTTRLASKQNTCDYKSFHKLDKVRNCTLSPSPQHHQHQTFAFILHLNS